MASIENCLEQPTSRTRPRNTSAIRLESFATWVAAASRVAATRGEPGTPTRRHGKRHQRPSGARSTLNGGYEANWRRSTRGLGQPAGWPGHVQLLLRCVVTASGLDRRHPEGDVARGARRDVQRSGAAEGSADPRRGMGEGDVDEGPGPRHGQDQPVNIRSVFRAAIRDKVIASRPDRRHPASPSAQARGVDGDSHAAQVKATLDCS